MQIDLLKKIVIRNKFSYEEIKNKEQEVLTTIQFNLDLTTTYELINQLFDDFMYQYQNIIEDKNIFCSIRRRSIYITFMCCYDYAMLKYK